MNDTKKASLTLRCAIHPNRCTGGEPVKVHNN